jgi:hypothetical protein
MLEALFRRPKLENVSRSEKNNLGIDWGPLVTLPNQIEAMVNGSKNGSLRDCVAKQIRGEANWLSWTYIPTPKPRPDYQLEELKMSGFDKQIVKEQAILNMCKPSGVPPVESSLREMAILGFGEVEEVIRGMDKNFNSKEFQKSLRRDPTGVDLLCKKIKARESDYNKHKRTGRNIQDLQLDGFIIGALRYEELYREAIIAGATPDKR